MSKQEPVICKCGDEYPSRSYGAGFIHGAGMCPNCDAALTDADRSSMQPMRELTEAELDALWTAYQTGPISADHTDKDAFKETIRLNCYKKAAKEEA